MLHTGTCIVCLVLIPHEELEWKEKVTAYVSRTLRPSERNFPTQMEFLAPKWVGKNRVSILYDSSLKLSQITTRLHMC